MKFALKAVWAVEVISRAYARYKVGGAEGECVLYLKDSNLHVVPGPQAR